VTGPKQSTQRTEWVVFGLRWLLPAAIALRGLMAYSAGETGIPDAALVLALVGSVYNLIVLLVLSSGTWSREAVTTTVALDWLLTVAAMAAVDPLLVWMGLLPSVVVGARYGWRYSLGVSGSLLLASFVVLSALSRGAPSPGDLGWLGLSALMMPMAGVLSDVLSDQTDLQESAARRAHMDSRRLLATREQMHMMYEMAATLSTTLDYTRVLDMAMDVGVHGLERLGAGERLSGAVLLFGTTEDDSLLRVARGRRLTPADERAIVPGTAGVIGKAIRTAEPAITNNPHDDPELRYFGAFRACETVICVPMRAGYENYGMLIFGSPKPDAFYEDHVALMQTLANQATAALQNAKLYRDLLEEKERIVEIEEEARKQLARDLHDGPTQGISAVAMRVNFIRRLLERDPESALDELWKVEELARKTAKEIRHMLFTLRPLVLETQGLGAALEQLADKMKDTHEQNVSVQVETGVEEVLDSHVQGVVFYIVEEAVNNARKYAQAEVIEVRLSVHGDVALIEVEDNGVGFDVEEELSNYEKRGSLGMVNLRERTHLIDGNLRIESEPGKGTKVTVVVPIQQATPEETEPVEAEP
jgi:signal transduction histidine kinase